MKYIIEINMDNDAFRESPAMELSDILTKLVGSMSDGLIPVDVKIRDNNGNSVGTASLCMG